MEKDGPSPHSYAARCSITDILPVKEGDPKCVVGKLRSSKEGILFCYRAVTRAIQACLERSYTEFDAPTMAKCCHGIAARAQMLILEAQKLDLQDELQRGLRKLDLVSKASQLGDPQIEWHLPPILLELTKFYILSYVKESDKERSLKTVSERLLDFSHLSCKCRRKIIRRLQNDLSNRVTDDYTQYLSVIDPQLNISDFPVHVWGKYVQEEHLRYDREGRRYASTLFSTQLVLAHLIQSESLVALASDIYDESENHIGRFLQLFKGAQGKLQPLPSEDLEKLEPSHPVAVFGGCTHISRDNLQKAYKNLREWTDRFPQLILACDVFYPQFSEVETCPVIPDEQSLREKLLHHLGLSGFSSQDPHIFCTSHIYVASVEQLRGASEKHLPTSFIPSIAQRTSLPYSSKHESLLREHRPAA